MIDIRSKTLSEWENVMRNFNQPEYRAGQIFSHIHRHQSESYETMTDLPKDLRVLLHEKMPFPSCKIIEKIPSQADESSKYLFAMENNTIMESVLMKHKHGHCVCVSTQAGCRMGCRFCASTVGGFQRNLTAGEIAGQVYGIIKDIQDTVDSVVLMGCGEPLDNLQNCLRFFSLINHPKGLHIGLRKISLSTCGLVPQMKELAEHRLPITLAVSLHAPNDVLRRQLMPAALKYTITDIMAACDYYTETTRRRITFEYALIRGCNDSDNQAVELARLLKNRLCHVNLLPINPVSPEFKPSKRLRFFNDILTRYGITTTIRRSLGSDIQAACGQLRKYYLDI
jgi:23S rRNA (adenine2503-C2)-methyltransferase